MQSFHGDRQCISVTKMNGSSKLTASMTLNFVLISLYVTSNGFTVDTGNEKLWKREKSRICTHYRWALNGVYAPNHAHASMNRSELHNRKHCKGIPTPLNMYRTLSSFTKNSCFPVIRTHLTFSSSHSYVKTSLQIQYTITLIQYTITPMFFYALLMVCEADLLTDTCDRLPFLSHYTVNTVRCLQRRDMWRERWRYYTTTC